MQIKSSKIPLNKNTSCINFRGNFYPNRCSYCRLPIEDKAIILLGTELIFCDEDCVTGFIGSRAADITVREEGDLQCMLS